MSIPMYLLLLGTTNAQWNIDNDMGAYLDATAFSSSQESMILFSGAAFQYVSLVEEQTYPISALTTINNFPDSWDHVQAAVSWGPDQLLLFQGKEYVVFDPVKNSCSAISTWGGWPVEWQGQVDAAVQWDENKIMFFLADDYVLFDMQTQSYSEPDLIINWEGWPANWNDGISSALNIRDGFIYFFRNAEFLAFDLEKNSFVGPMKTVNTIAKK